MLYVVEKLSILQLPNALSKSIERVEFYTQSFQRNCMDLSIVMVYGLWSTFSLPPWILNENQINQVHEWVLPKTQHQI